MEKVRWHSEAVKPVSVQILCTVLTGLKPDLLLTEKLHGSCV